MTLVAGVDSSTQSCKVLIRDLDTGAIVRTGRANHPNGTEVDPEAWWLALQSAILDAGGLDDVAAISIGGQQHGMVALDGEGRVIRPALLWNDTRSAPAALDLIAELGDGDRAVGAARFAERTGGVPVASFTLTKLRWLADAEPENAARVAAVALPHDWLTWRLRGFGPENPNLDELTTDASDASGTSYLNPATGEYDRELLSLALRRDAAAIRLPRLVAPGQSSGTVAATIAPNTPMIAGGCGDNAGAALGLGAIPGDIVVSIGTSGTVFAVSETPTRDSSGTVAGFADASGHFLPLIATLNAARVLDSIAALLGVTHDELGTLAVAAEPGAGGAVLLPYFEGERTPNIPDATASLSGLTLASTTRENIARSAVEGLLCGLADGLDALLGQGVESTRVLLIGGAAQNPAVSAIAAQVFPIPAVVPEPAEYVAAGAAVQAAWALSGTRPAWPVTVKTEPPVDYRPVIRQQYASAAHRIEFAGRAAARATSNATATATQPARANETTPTQPAQTAKDTL